MSVLESTIDRFRQPEYTGDNRCMPCTIVNAIIAVVLAAALALVWLPLGLAAIVVAALAIYARGYLVPGTPTLTQRYFPEWLLQLFGKEPLPERHHVATVEDDVGVDELLLEADVVEPCADEDDLCLTETFEDELWSAIRQLRASEAAATAQLASILELPAAELAVEDRDEKRVVRHDGDTIGTWDSKAAYLADVAVEPLLDARIAGWKELDGRLRTQALAGLRVFLEACPVCDSELEHVENVRESCCGSDIVGVAIECPSCESRVFSGSIR